MIYLHFRGCEWKSFLFSTGKNLCLLGWTTDVFMYLNTFPNHLLRLWMYKSSQPILYYRKSKSCIQIYHIKHNNLSMSNYLSGHHGIRVLLNSYLTCPSVSMAELHYLPCIFPIALAVKMSLSCWDVPNPDIKLSRENYSKLFTAANHGSQDSHFSSTWSYALLTINTLRSY